MKSMGFNTFGGMSGAQIKFPQLTYGGRFHKDLGRRTGE